jgi:hypothetical protein
MCNLFFVVVNDVIVELIKNALHMFMILQCTF